MWKVGLMRRFKVRPSHLPKEVLANLYILLCARFGCFFVEIFLCILRGKQWHKGPWHNHNVWYSQNKLQFRQLSTQTISQEISEIKEKIKSYEADLQAAKQKGDKEEVKLLREDIRTEKNLLIKLQEKENLLIAKDSNNKGKIFSSILFFFNHHYFELFAVVLKLFV
jgi:hypothetical protein